MLRDHYYNIFVIFLLLPIIIGFLANPCEAQSECRKDLLLRLMDECFRQKRDVNDAEKMATINGKYFNFQITQRRSTPNRSIHKFMCFGEFFPFPTLGADESILHNNEHKLLNPETTITTSRTNPIISGIVSSASKYRQPPAVAIAPIFGRLYLTRLSEPRNDGSRFLSETQEQGGGVGSGFDMTIGEIEEIYFELFERSPRHSPKAPLDNALRGMIARCCQNVPLCIKNRDYPPSFNCSYHGGGSV